MSAILRSSFLIATEVAAFEFLCFNQNKVECSLNHLHPEEGTFVLQHIPTQAYMLTFTNLIATTVDHTILAKLTPSITYLLVNDSARVRNFILPGNSSIERLFLYNTRVSAIRFENNDMLYMLSIEKARLKHIPSTLANLKNLSYVKISHTPLKQLDLSFFCKLRRLQIINLNHNKIHLITAQQYANCGSLLVEMWLANNRLKRVDPNVFVQLSKLESVTLSDNVIDTFSGSFKNTLIGGWLALNHNLLPTLDLCEWSSMPYVSALSIEWNKLTHVPMCLERMPNLEMINLEHNQLSNVAIDVFKELKQLQHLRLSENPIVTFTIHRHSLPPSLFSIDIRHVRLQLTNISQALAQSVKIMMQCAAFQFRCQPVNTNFTCTITNYSPKLEGTFLFNHMPERTNNIDFKNLILPIVDNTIFSYLPTAVSTLTFSGSRAVRAIIVPQNISLFEITVAEPSMVRMRFAKNCTLSKLYITQSSLIEIPPTLSHLKNLFFFKLSQSPIEQISLERFCNLSQLQSLNLKYNLITTISFRGATVPWCGPALVKLTLSYNKLRIVNMTVFASMRELQILDLENNLIEFVEGRFTNPNITTVILTSNKLLAIDLCRWNAMPSLNSFSFYKNSLQLIPKCLDRMPAVKFINFNSNKLTRINIEAFAMLNQLKSLFFTNNAIRSIVNHRRPLPSSLKEIYLEHNPLPLENVTKFFPSSLRNFQASTFDRSMMIRHIPRTLDRLEFVDSRALQRFVLPSNFSIRQLMMTKTQLSRIELHSNNAVRELIIVSSKLQQVPASIGNLKSLVNIKLQQSYIPHLNLSILQWFSELRSLELPQNRIRTVTSTLNSGQRRKFYMLNLSYNQLRILNLEVLAAVGWFMNVDVSHNKIELLVGRFTSVHLSGITLSYNRLKTLDFCQWKPMPSLTSLSLQSNELSRVPNCMHHLPSLSNINLNNNKLTCVDMDAFGDMEDLLDLDLSANQISLIVFREEKYPKRLEELILSRNKIECINPGDMPFCPLDIEFIPSSSDSPWKRNNNTLQRQLTITTA
ncbi:protein artichoke-like [Anopheles marshallii]|uniref:protein artichoke-like n=1 Tax=Anopheles marshallii TaxID=1521116 RepID=UPI00237C1C94|nr:protein artichoke-like [Anopheles marshallii]